MRFSRLVSWSPLQTQEQDPGGIYTILSTRSNPKHVPTKRKYFVLGRQLKEQKYLKLKVLYVGEGREVSWTLVS